MVNKKLFFKFIFFSFLGIIIFLFPIKYNNEYNVFIGILSEKTKIIILPYSDFIMFSVFLLGIIGNIYFKIVDTKLKGIKNIFEKGNKNLVIKILSFIIFLMIVLDFGPSFILDEKTGKTMINLLKTLISWFMIASFLMPLLTSYGLMEFVGTFMSKYTRKLFLIPGRSTIDLLASWVGNCNVGVILTTKQYEKGFYTKKESTIIATCFSSVSLPFCLVICAILEIKHLFIQYYFTSFIVSLILAVILCRIYPIKSIENEYYHKVGKQIEDEIKKDKSLYKTAIANAINTVKKSPSIKELLLEGLNLYLDILFTLTPYVMLFGTIALTITYYTNIFYYISYPLIIVLNIFKIPYSSDVAPALLVGFIDMIIPVVIGSEIMSVKAKFLIAVISTIQIIYMTEVGALLMSSKLKLNIFTLFLIFIERTVLSIPIIIFFMYLFKI